MTTLRDLKPCIDAGHIAVRITPGSSEFVEARSEEYYYDLNGFNETYHTFDDLLEDIETVFPVLSSLLVLEGEQFLGMWDLLDDEEAS